MNYPPQVRKEIKAYQKMKKEQVKELAKLQAVETKLSAKVAALTEELTKAKIAVMRLQKSQAAAQGTVMGRFVMLSQTHGLTLATLIAEANQFNLNKAVPAPAPETAAEQP